MSGRTPYLGKKAATKGRTPYLGPKTANVSRTPYLGEKGGKTVTVGGSAHAKKHHGGFLAGLEHVVTQTGKDLANTALQSPGGIVALGKAVTADQIAALRHGDVNVISTLLRGKHTQPLLKGMAKQTVDTVKHPLRHPGDTLLLALPAAGRVAKVGEAAALAKAGGTAGDVVKAATVGIKPGPRVLHVGDMEVRGHYSRAAGSRVVQKLTDRALEKGAQRPGKVGVKVENQLHRRAAKWEGRNQRTADSVARAPGTAVAALGKKLKPDELRALRLVAEEVPVERRLGGQEMRKGRATNAKEQARHQERIDLTRAAMEHLTTDSEGRPVFKPEAAKLRKAYDALAHAAGDREGILKRLDLMDDQALQASKTKVAQVAAGGTYEAPTAAKLGKPSQSLLRQRAHVDRLQSLHDRATATVQKNAAKIAGEKDAVVGNRVVGPGAERLSTAKSAVSESQVRLAQLEKEHNQALDKIAGAKFGPVDMGEVRFRTRENAKAARQAAGVDRAGRKSGASGAKARTRPTVVNERRAHAEKLAQDAIAKDPTAPASVAWQSRLDEIEKLRERLNPMIGEGSPTGTVTGHGRVVAPNGAARADRLGAALSVEKDRLAQMEKAAAARVKPTGVVGADDIEASPDAVHIGNPVEVTKLRGKPKVSSGGTIGHTTKPTSLKVSTGGSVEHALERNDVTNIVSERHAEAVRLGKIDRVVQKFKQAGDVSPRRKDDVFMWTDKVVSNERIPDEVRAYLDNPESVAKLSTDEQSSMFDKIREATFEKQDWRDPSKVAEFEKLAKDGKGVFVPRKLLGEFAKRSYSIGDNPAVKFTDAVNNAQKVGLIYLKLNYPVVQGVSNAAMNIIHQGFAYPRNLTAAIRLEAKVGPEYAAITDDIMGQGAVAQAQLEGQGAIARGSHKLADVMGSKVDRPARRAAFYHEAVKAGYGTPEKYRALLEDDAHAGDLAEVAQRAREAIVDYGDMGPVERNIVRRLVFVYPWQKGATKYAGHFLRDHPVQAAALAQLGELGKQQSDDTFGPVPSYLEGLIPVGDRAVNPAGVNFFQTPAQIGTAAGGFLSGNPAQASAGLGFLAPAPGIVMGLASGRDDIGRPLEGNAAAKIRDLSIAQTPAAAVGRALAPSLPSPLSGLASALLGDQGASKTFPDPNDPYWRFLLGGLYARDYSRPALNQNAAREKTGR